MEDEGKGVTGEEEEEEEEDSLEQLRFVFNLCDNDRDGVISVDEFRRIGRDHFDRTKPMEVLIQLIDPEGSGRVTFSMFRAGIETFLTSRSIRSRSTSQGSSNIDAPSSPTELSSMSEEAFDSVVHPLFPSSHSLIPNGYHTDSSPSCDLISLSGDGEDDAGTPLHSSPLPLRRQSFPSNSTIRETPGGRLRATRHSQLALPVSPAGSHSKCSTPAEFEAEEMVSQLSDQLQDLSSKMEYLEEDQRHSLGARERLRREREVLQERMVEYEERIRSTEQLSQRTLQENEERHAVSINRLRRESQAQLDDVTSQLQGSREEIERYRCTEANLRAQLATANERLEECEGRVGVLEEREGEREGEVRRARELLRAEKEERRKEKEAHSQVVAEYESQIRGWQKACEEVGREKKRRSLTVSDMDSEVSRLNKEIEKLKRDNEGLQARFLEHGKELLSQKTRSLADEMEDASKDDVMEVLRDTELHNARLHEYIDGLLVSIIDKHPELLEKR